jgi:3-oxoadipate enol-lactonase
MNILHRHSWGLQFETWLNSAGFKSKPLRLARGDGLSELIALGDISALDRPIVIFLHGLGNDALFPNLNLFRYLLETGYNVVTADIDGHGKNCTSKLSSSTIRTLVEGVIEQLDQLTVGRPRIHLCGYSFGAVLMLDFAVHHPERVQSLSLIGMPLYLQSSFLIMTEILSPLSKSYLASLKDYGIIGIQPAIGPILRERYPVRLHEAEIGSYLHVGAKIIEQINPLSKLELVTFPTLLINGGLDFVANHAGTVEFLDSLEVQRFTLKGETHFTCMLSQKMARRIEVLLRTSP